jgi:hypothetical protein
MTLLKEWQYSYLVILGNEAISNVCNLIQDVIDTEVKKL